MLKRNLLTKQLFITCAIALGIALFAVTTDAALQARAGTSLDGNNRLQLDASQTTVGCDMCDNGSNPITYMWKIGLVGVPPDHSREGQIVSIKDLDVGTYQVTLTVTDSFGNISGDEMILGIPAEVGVVIYTPNELQQLVLGVKVEVMGAEPDPFHPPDPGVWPPDPIIVGPTLKAAENRKRVLLSDFDKASDFIGIGDLQAAIVQLRNAYVKFDEGVGTSPGLAPDWIIGTGTEVIAIDTLNAINAILKECLGCN